MNKLLLATLALLAGWIGQVSAIDSIRSALKKLTSHFEKPVYDDSLPSSSSSTFFSSVQSLRPADHVNTATGVNNNNNMVERRLVGEVLTLIDINMAMGLGSNPQNLIEFHGNLYFTANGGDGKGRELWALEPTPRRVTDINVGSGDSFDPNDPSAPDFIVFNDFLYFPATDGMNGVELYKMDTTEAVTLVANINTMTGGSSNPGNFIEFSDDLYITADDGINGKELWMIKPDDTTTLVNINPTALAGSDPLFPIVFKEKLYFWADDGTGYQLWSWDGTDPAKVAGGAGFLAFPAKMIEYMGSLYFAADDGSAGIELYKTDGTTISRVADINTGPGGSFPGNFFVYKDLLFFSATDGTNGIELYKMDGTAVTAMPEINSGGNASPSGLLEYDNKLFFSADGGTGVGRRLWFLASATATPKLINSMTLGSFVPTIPLNHAVVEEKLYFTADDGLNGNEVWVTQGTDMTTRMVQNIYSTDGSNPDNFVVFKGKMYFVADDGVNGKELWELGPPLIPSAMPSSAPSFMPSLSPSAAPSKSFMPSLSPSAAPSDTYMPSLVPSGAPSTSAAPSESFMPNQAPTATPAPSSSFMPSLSPSTVPSTSPMPSLSPSAAPSISAAPSDSFMPSQAPVATAAPSGSFMPSSAPSSTTSTLPTPIRCFSSMSRVDVRGKGSIPIDTLKVGDYVRVGGSGGGDNDDDDENDDKFAQVYSYAHYHPNIKAEFIQLYTQVHTSPLELTPEHLVFVIQKDHRNGTVRVKAVPASSIKVGDYMLLSSSRIGTSTPVTKIATVGRQGVYAPITTTGEIMVNGVLASTYATFYDTEAVSLPLSYQWIAHAAFAPHRLACAINFDWCLKEKHDSANGISNWVSGFYWVLQQPMAAKIAGLGFIAPYIFVAFSVETVIMTYWRMTCIASLVLGMVVWAYFHRMMKQGGKDIAN